MKTFLCLALSLGVLGPQARLFPQSVTIGAEDAVGLWGSTTGGCGNDLVAAAFEAVKFDVQLAIVPYARAKALTLAGEYAGCFSMIWEKDLEGKIVFAAKPLYSARTIFVQRKRATKIARDLAALPKGSTIGTTRGYEYDFSVGDLKKRGMTVVETNSEANALAMLGAGRLEVVAVYVDELKSLASILKASNIDPSSVEVAFEESSTDVFVGFSLANPQGPLAKEKFDEGFSLIKKNGTYEAILAKWKQKNS